MGFYLRKSIKVGPFRFNLSKSGVGVSAGIKGLRVGSGPRGNYVHMSLLGVQYRTTVPKTIPSTDSAQSSSETKAPPVLPTSATHAPLEEIESADVTEIVDSSSAELLQEIREKRGRLSASPFAAVATAAILLLGLAAGWPVWALLSILAAGVVATVLLYRRDLLRKTVVVFYDFDPAMEAAYGSLHQWAETLAGCARTWHIEAQGEVYDRKYHAGASNLVQRRPTFIKRAEPPYLKTNVETIAIGVGRQVLHLFPDRALIYQAGQVGAVGYGNLQLEVSAVRFIEDGGVPADAQVVDHTWRYVNKKGGPDRRFKDNRQLPICLYDEIWMRSDSGLNEVLQLSRSGIGEGFTQAVRYLASKLPN